MEVIDNFTVEPTPPVERDRTDESFLLFDGRQTGRILKGVTIEAQYRCGEAYLLLTTEDSPFEEGLHIYFLGADYEVLDEVELSHIYTPGGLENLRVTEENALEFSFFGDDVWRLTVLEQPRRGIPNSPLSFVKRALSRAFGKQYLELKALRLNRAA